MPTPGQIPTPGQMAKSAAFDRVLGSLRERNAPELAYEVAELRKEIAALRVELTPVPSLIMTGRQALDEFKRLTGR